MAWRALARAVLVIPRVLDHELLESQGLNLTEYSVLVNLPEQPGRSMRMSELADAVCISISGLTRVVERLARQGLAERVRAETDGRGQLAVLTAAGYARLEKAYPARLASVRKHVMDHLVNIDLVAFTNAIVQIAEAGEEPPVRRIRAASLTITVTTSGPRTQRPGTNSTALTADPSNGSTPSGKRRRRCRSRTGILPNRGVGDCS